VYEADLGYNEVSCKHFVEANTCIQPVGFVELTDLAAISVSLFAKSIQMRSRPASNGCCPTVLEVTENGLQVNVIISRGN
jgi:hypothetical protein